METSLCIAMGHLFRIRSSSKYSVKRFSEASVLYNSKGLWTVLLICLCGGIEWILFHFHDAAYEDSPGEVRKYTNTEHYSLKCYFYGSFIDCTSRYI